MSRLYWLVCFAVFFCLALSVPGCADDDSGSDSDDDSQSAGDNSNDRGEFSPPDQGGPYRVGVRTFVYADTSRPQSWGDLPRTLLTDVWYPTQKESAEKNTISAMVGPLPDWAPFLFKMLYGDQAEPLLNSKTRAWRDAEPFLDDGPYPVVIFSHGLAAVRFQNYTLCEQIASHGFVVVSPDHYDNAIFTNLPEGLIFFNPISIVGAEIERPRDIAFLVDTLKAEAEKDFFSGLIDMENIGLTGHSYGGMTSYMAGVRVSDIDAIAPINPVFFYDQPETFVKPMLTVVSDNDNIANLFDSKKHAREVHNNHKGNRVFLKLKNAGHYSATDACALLPPDLIPDETTGCGGAMMDSTRANEIVGAYSIAYFSVTLKGDDRYLDSDNFAGDIDHGATWDKSGENMP